MRASLLYISLLDNHVVQCVEHDYLFLDFSLEDAQLLSIGNGAGLQAGQYSTHTLSSQIH